VTNLGDHSSRDLAITVALAEGSSHPLSQSLVKAITASGLHPAKVTDITEIPGHGTEGRWKGQTVRLGRASWVGGGESQDTCAWLRVGHGEATAFRFIDQIRDGAEALVTQLHDDGFKVVLMSGDTTSAVEAFAERLGIAHWVAEALPEDKAARIADLGGQGAHVLMVGDGLNDTAALAGAHVSISPASALDAARVASDVVLLGKSLEPIADALSTAKVATRRIRQNFTIATWYNIIAVPLAVAGLCSPLIAALAMSTSSITVSLNALRLK
jgi:Cu2+-exporting ATPase